MGEVVGQKKKFGIKDKIKLDEYENFVESTAREALRLKLHGRGVSSYIIRIYEGNTSGLLKDIPQKQFLADTLQLLQKKTH